MEFKTFTFIQISALIKFLLWQANVFKLGFKFEKNVHYF